MNISVLNKWSEDAKDEIFYFIEQVTRLYTNADIQQWLWINVPKLIDNIEMCWIQYGVEPDMDQIFQVIDECVIPTISVYNCLEMLDVLYTMDLPTAIITVKEFQLIDRALELGL